MDSPAESHPISGDNRAEEVTLLAIRAFVSTVRNGGPAAAADELQMRTVAVKRHLQRLEAALCAVLFKRTDKGAMAPGAPLTIEGALLFEASETILSALTAASMQIDEVRTLRAQQPGTGSGQRVANG